MFEDYRGISRQAMFLIYAGFIPALTYGLLYTDLSYFLPIVQGVSSDFMSIVLTIMGLSVVSFSIPLGIAADRYGRKRMLIVGNVVASLVVALFALTTNVYILFVAAVLEGASEAAFSSSSGALLADLAGDEKRMSAFSLLGFLSSIASGVGCFAIPLVVVFQFFGFSSRSGHVMLYLVVATLGLLSTVFVLKIGKTNTVQRGGGIRGFVPKKSRNVLIKYIVANSMIALGAGLFYPLMTYWFKLQYGVPDTISGPILGISSILIGISALAAPSLARRVGIVKSIVITQGVSTAFMLATPFAPEFSLASVFYTARTFLMNVASPLQQSMIMGLVTPEERGAASGISTALWRLPNSFSVYAGRWLMDQGLLAEPFYVATLLYVVSIAAFWRFFNKVKMSGEAVVGVN